MRSSYDIADELDFVPMNRFQKEFFLTRADEWARYRMGHDEMKNAVSVSMFDLSDPLYFDFISAVQYATIAGLMRDPAPAEFEERLGVEAAGRLVRRDPAVRDALLPSLFLERVGDRILDALLVNFSGPDFYTQPPPPCPPATGGGVAAAAAQRSAVDGIRRLYAVLAENGYAQAAAVSDDGDVDAKGAERVSFAVPPPGTPGYGGIGEGVRGKGLGIEKGGVGVGANTGEKRGRRRAGSRAPARGVDVDRECAVVTAQYPDCGRAPSRVGTTTVNGPQ